MENITKPNGLNVGMLVLNSLNPDPRVWKEAKCLADNGHNVIIYAENHENLEDVSVYENVRIERVFSPNIDSLYPWKNIPSWLSFCSFVLSKDREKCDVYHCNDAETLFFGYVLCKKDKAVMVYDAHEYFSDYYVPSKNHFLEMLKFYVSNNAKLIFERIFISKCKAVITVSEGISDLLKRDYGLKLPPLVLRNSLPLSNIQYSKKLQKLLAVKEDKKLMIFHGTMTEARQIKRIIKFLPMLKSINVMLVLMGEIDSRYKIDLVNYSDLLGVTNMILFCEVKYEEVLAYLSGARIEVYFVKPTTLSIKHSMPNKLFEALMAELPIVLDKEFVEMRNIIEKYNVGIAVDSDNEVETVAAIKTLLEDQDYYLSIKDNIRKSRNELCWENDSKGLINLYKTMKDSKCVE